MNTSDYTYTLPQDKIANYPLPRRDAAKLLVFKENRIAHDTFLSLADHLPDNACLFFNNTRVIPARLHFTKESGARIEIFLLNPLLPSPLLNFTIDAKRRCTWQCTIGNLKKWPSGALLQRKAGMTTLSAELKSRSEGRVEFSWDSDETFGEIIQRAGETPLPPYIKRKAEADDRERYQTIYSYADGAVAAPTAGLHFTPAVFNSLKARGITHDFLTLHVSAGTFQPIKTENPDDHVMHEEQIIITRDNLAHILAPEKNIIAVGTTSMRSLESLYWYGAKLLINPDAAFRIGQRDPYDCAYPPSVEAAMTAVAGYMDENRLDSLVGETSIFIRPGYDFKVCKGLITNFHQPGSTLILLVAAFVGKDWRKIYEAALENSYRFLSYGDSSLLIPPDREHSS